MTTSLVLTKKDEIVINKIKDAFKGHNNREMPLEVISDSLDPIMLCSPIIIINSDVKINVTLNVSFMNSIISGSIVKNDQFDENNIETMIEFANRMNKNFGSVGYLVFYPVDRRLIMRFAIILVDGRIDTNRLLSCFDIALQNAIDNFKFLDCIDISDFNSGELLLKYREFYNNINKFINKELN